MTNWEGRCGCDMPERPLSFGAYICSQPGCRLSVEATARQYPSLKLVIKFGGPRQVITARQFLDATDPLKYQQDEAIENLLDFSVNGREDYIREIFVMEGTGAPV